MSTTHRVGDDTIGASCMLSNSRDAIPRECEETREHAAEKKRIYLDDRPGEPSEIHHEAAIKVQAAYRGHHARKSVAQMRGERV